jgi:WD40-like Beta Propeller Repeat
MWRRPRNVSEFDDRLKRELRRAAVPGDPAGAFDRVARKRNRRRAIRRVQVAALAIGVVVGSVGGSLALARTFRRSDLPAATVRSIGNGPIAYVDFTVVYGREGTGPFRGFQGLLYSVQADGSDRHRLSASRGIEYPAWSPDGRWLAYTDVDSTGQRWDLVIAHPDGSARRTLVEGGGHNRSPAWSPDGTQIAFISDRGDERDAVYTINVDGTHLRRLTPARYTVSGRSLSWSPDGREIAFVAETFTQSLLPRAAHPLIPLEIHTIAVDGSNPHDLTDRISGVDSVAWSPDGTHMLLDSAGSIFEMTADGSEIRRLAKNAQQPAWSPDGQWIAFIGNGQVNYQGTSTTDVGLVSVMRADGTQRHVVARCQDQCLAPAWQPIPHTPAPSPIITPSQTPPSSSPTPAAPSCEASTRQADFDGDGKLDIAIISCSSLLVPGSLSWSIDVKWGAGPAGTWPMPECQEVCRAFTVPDLNNDGKAELGVVVHQDPVESIKFFELPASEHGPFVFKVAAPGSQLFPSAEPAVFRVGGAGGTDVSYDTLQCATSHGERILIASRAIGDPNDVTMWIVHETRLALRDGAFVVLSSRDYTSPISANPPFDSREQLCGSNFGGDAISP